VPAALRALRRPRADAPVAAAADLRDARGAIVVPSRIRAALGLRVGAAARAAAAAAAAGAVVAAATAGGSGAAPAAVTCAWRTEVDARGPFLSAVARARSDVWAVGARETVGAASRPVVTRRTPRGWRPVVLPRLGSGSLEGVAVAPTGAVWAVGSESAGDFALRPVVLRRSPIGWRRVAAPQRHGLVRLLSVDATAGVWVVGGDYLSGVRDPIVIQRARPAGGWATVPGARIAEGVVQAVDARTAGDAWAVGYSGGAATINTIDALAMRWDGRRWAATTLPAERIVDPSRETDDVLDDVVAVSAREAVAVGADQAGGAVLAWDGAAWTRETAPAVSTLEGVDAAAGTVFAVGSRNGRPVVLRRTGGRWTEDRLPPGVRGRLADVVVAGPQEAWSVGGDDGNGAVASRTLVLRLSCR
jgi:hypothetical protein